MCNRSSFLVRIMPRPGYAFLDSSSWLVSLRLFQYPFQEIARTRPFRGDFTPPSHFGTPKFVRSDRLILGGARRGW